MKKWEPFLYSILGLCFTAALWLSFTTSIQLNESYSLWLATKPIKSIIESQVQDFMLPLFPVILHLWIQIFGADIIMARILSIIFLALTVYFLKRLAHEASDEEQVSLVTILLFSLSPFILWYTTETETYALFTLAVAANHLYFLRMIRSGAKEGKLGYFLSTVAGLFTHYLFIFLIVSQMAYIFGRFVFGQLRNRGLRKFAFVYFVLTAIAGSLFAAWIRYLIGFGLALPQKLQITPTSLPYAGQLFINYFFGFPTTSFQNILISLWPVSIVFLFLILTHDASMKLKNALYFIVVTFLPMVLTLFVSFLQPFFASRYLIFTVPTLYLLTGWLLINFSKKVFPFFIVLVIAAAVVIQVTQITSPSVPVKENYKTVDDYINRNVTPYDIIAVSSPFAIFPVEYYYTGPARIITIPPWNQYGNGVIPKFSMDGMISRIASFKGTYGRIFVILSYDRGYNSNISYYLDHHYERLAFHVYPPNIELRVYRLSYDFPVPPLP